MFPLASKDFPTSVEELTSGIRDALATVLALPKKGDAVSATGKTFPALQSLTIDLDGAEVDPSNPPAKFKPSGKTKPGVTVEKLELSAKPLRYQKAKLELDLTARGVTLDFDRDKQDHPLLVLSDAKDGKVQAKISKADLQAVLLEGATLAARQQGVAVQDLQLDLTQEGPRSVAVVARVKAKKMMMSGTVVVRGRADVDDELNATLSGLGVTGEGMVGAVAAGFLEKKLQSFEGKQIPLMAFSLGDVTLRDLKIKVDSNVTLTAAFGGEA